MSFKVGDRVICINPPLLSRSPILLNKEYVISSIHIGSRNKLRLLIEGNSNVIVQHEWYADRFILVHASELEKIIYGL